jgi:hypothetical protein
MSAQIIVTTLSVTERTSNVAPSGERSPQEPLSAPQHIAEQKHDGRSKRAAERSAKQ